MALVGLVGLVPGWLGWSRGLCGLGGLGLLLGRLLACLLARLVGTDVIGAGRIVVLIWGQLKVGRWRGACFGVWD